MLGILRNVMILNSGFKKERKKFNRSSYFLEKAAEALASTPRGHAAPKFWGVS